MADNRAEKRRALAAAAFAIAVIGVALWLLGTPALSRFGPHGTNGPDRTPLQGNGAGPEAGTVPGYVAQVETRGTIDPERGGALDVPGGAGRLAIPAGALASATDVRVRVLRDEAGGGAVVDLQPDGLALRTPARLELQLPAGWQASEAEVAVFDTARGEWIAEPRAVAASDPDHVAADITHFSLRRVRIRPGMNFPYDPNATRGTFFLESDPANNFETFVAGRWQSVGRRTPAYRDLLKLGRLGRHDLIASGRLRAVAITEKGPEVMSDDLRAVVLPASAPESRSGWVRLVRLDESGRVTPFATIARVLRAEDALMPADAAATGTVRMSRAALEALGLTWGEEFGITSVDAEHTWVNVPAARPGDPPTRYVPLRVESWNPENR